MVWALVILSPIAFGASDFLGGFFTKRLSVWAVIGVSSAACLVGSVIWGLVAETLYWDGQAFGAGAVAGVLLLAANAAFFRALSLGKAGFVSAIVALAVAVPIIADLVTGSLPSTISLVGIVAMVLGVILMSVPEARGGMAKSVILLSLLAALLFGFQFLALDRGSTAGPDAAIIAEFTIMTLCIAILGLTKRHAGGLQRSDIPKLIGMGVLFLIGSISFTTAMTQVNVAIASAFVEAEPVVLAILGLVVLKERLVAIQWFALLVVIAGAAAASAT